ncbi:MAG: DNA topoisomerase 3 [Deltaproteobacteria bacterium]|nr:DNA topoisomerase 3 [Deltaproteobacteria bacterium]
MRLVLAEKPSMARSIAAALGVTGKGRNCLQGEVGGHRVVVSWCVGHLVEPADADHYGAKAWSFHTLPIVPRPFAYVPIAATRDQFDTVKDLLLRPDVEEVVNATDAGREGQLIFHLVYDLAGCTKPIKRLWTSALTEDAIRAAWAHLRDESEFAGLTAAAHCRQQADWLVGINCTRAQTLVARALGETGVRSIGRVQTPTLAILVRRENEISHFVPKDFWTLVARFRTAQGQTYTGRWFRLGDGDAPQERFDTEAAALELRQRLMGRQAHVQKVDKKQERKKPELLYDLTALQREANKRFGYTAEQTLAIAQELYEAQLISYPRTNSRYLTQQDAAQAPAWLQALDRGPWAGIVGQVRSMGSAGTFPPVGKRFVDDKEVEDHPAITVTNKPVRVAEGQPQLSPEQQRVYDLVARRLLSTWFGDRVEHKTTVVTAVQDTDGKAELFKTVGTVVADLGWTGVDQPRRDKPARPDDDDTELPPLRRGEPVDLVDLAAKAGKTSPPKPLTEADVLAAMQGAGKLVDDEELRGAMKDSGLGTPATRANIIETLIKRDYAARKGKNLVATPRGVALIGDLPLESLKSPEMTGQWEATLERIRRGAADPAAFVGDIERFTAQAVDDLRRLGAATAAQPPQSATAAPARAQCLSCRSPMTVRSFADVRVMACTGLLRPACRASYAVDADDLPTERCAHCDGPRQTTRSGPRWCLRCGRGDRPEPDRPPWPALHACPQCRHIARAMWVARNAAWAQRCDACDQWIATSPRDETGEDPPRPPCARCGRPMAAVWSRQRGAWMVRCVQCGTWAWSEAPQADTAAR